MSDKIVSPVRTETMKVAFAALPVDDQLREVRSVQAYRSLVDPFDYAVDAEIHDWHRSYVGHSNDYVIWGRCFRDITRRFAEGQIFCTSLIVKEVADRAVSLNSIYRLIGEPLSEVRHFAS